MRTLYAKAVGFALVSLALLSGCASMPRSEVVVANSTNECVVLLHGLNRSWRAMRPMAESLQNAGFTTVNVDYPSQAGSVEDIAPMAVTTGLNGCRAAGADRIHFVTHSIGGILLRYQQKQASIPDLGRVVMLGPPNQGSEVIDKTRHWPGANMLSGDAGAQMGTDENSLPFLLGPVDFELGVIAGTGTNNILMSALLPNPDDGKVSVARTQVEGMDDFLVVSNSHYYIARGDVVFRNTESFLKRGVFLADDKATMPDCQCGGSPPSVASP